MIFLDSVSVNMIESCSKCGKQPLEGDRTEMLDSDMHIVEIQCFSCRYPGWID